MIPTAFNRNAHHTRDFINDCQPGKGDPSSAVCGDQTPVACSKSPCCYGLTNDGQRDLNKSVPCYTYSKKKHPSGSSSKDQDTLPNCKEIVSAYGCKPLLTNGKTIMESCPHTCANEPTDVPAKDQLKNCADLVSQYDCSDKLTNGMTLLQACPQSCQPNSGVGTYDRLKNCPELVQSYGCDQLLENGTTVGVSCPVSCRAVKNPGKSPIPSQKIPNQSDKSNSVKNDCSINPCPNPEQYLTERKYKIPLGGTPKRRKVQTEFSLYEYQIPVAQSKSGVEGDPLTHRNTPECIYQLILWWWNNYQLTCKNGQRSNPGSRIAAMLALLAVAIIPLPCINRNPPFLAKKAWVLEMAIAAKNASDKGEGSQKTQDFLKDLSNQNVDLNDLNISTLINNLPILSEEYINDAFDNSVQSIFYDKVKANNLVEVYSSDDNSISAKIDVENWEPDQRRDSYEALLCFLSVIAQPLEWCTDGDCSSNLSLVSWMIRNCGNSPSNDECVNLELWKNHYNILGSNWTLASNLLIAGTDPNAKGKPENSCIIEDAINQASYYDCHKLGVTSENGASFASIDDLLNSIEKVQKSQNARTTLTGSQPLSDANTIDNNQPQSDAQVTTTKPTKTSNFNWPLFAAIAGVVLLVIVLIIGFVFLKKKADQGKK